MAQFDALVIDQYSSGVGPDGSRGLITHCHDEIRVTADSRADAWRVASEATPVPEAARTAGDNARRVLVSPVVLETHADRVAYLRTPAGATED